MSETPKVSPKVYTAKQFAELLSMDPKALRRIMRSMTTPDNQPGSGARWEIVEGPQADALRKRVANSHNRKVTQFQVKS